MTLLHLEFKIPAHAQIAFIYYYLLFTNFLTLYEFKTITLRILFDKWSWSMILLTWSHDFFKNAFWSANFAVFSSNLSRPNVNFMGCLNVDISTKKLHTLQEVPGNVTWLNSWRRFVASFFKGYPQCNSPTDTISRYLSVVCIKD